MARISSTLETVNSVYPIAYAKDIRYATGGSTESVYEKIESLSNGTGGGTGGNGQSSFVSFVFRRTGSEPERPTGGTFGNPIPDGNL